MTSRVHRTQSVSAVFDPLFYHLPSVKRHCELRVGPTRKMNAFSNEICLNVKHQPFIFQHIVQIYLNTYWYTPVRPYERRECCDRWISRWNNTSARSFFINTFSSTSKLLTPNMYCWSFKTLVTIYWTHLRVNGIWATSFCGEKMNNRTLFLRDAFSGIVAIFIVDKWRHSDVIVIKLTAVIQN